jgi:nitroimidazol reductase NimA-like FMN-containing flavoprotein (pyridoxamine 5'-phosphate oxidase superfamily)
MTEMSKEEIARFVMQDTFTGKLATVRKDGSSHVVPIWFVLDNENSKKSRRIRISFLPLIARQLKRAILGEIIG